MEGRILQEEEISIPEYQACFREGWDDTGKCREWQNYEEFCTFSLSIMQYIQCLPCMRPYNRLLSLNGSLVLRMKLHVFSITSVVSDFVILWTTAHQAPLSMGFPQQEYWSGLSCPPPGIFPTQGLNQCLRHVLHCSQILYHWATREALEWS